MASPSSRFVPLLLGGLLAAGCATARPASRAAPETPRAAPATSRRKAPGPADARAPASARPAPEARRPAARPAPRRGQVGIASFYADALAGRPTASGEPYDPRKATCAHKRLPFGTRLEIRVVATGRTARCRVNDRGPFVRGRVVDVSRAVARRLGLLDRGVAKVRIRVLP